MTWPRLYDSANPAAIASGSDVIVYINGSYAWTQAQRDRMHRCYRMSVLPDPAYMQHARGVDCEQGALSIPQVIACCKARHEDFHHQDFTAYASLSTMQGGLVTALKQTGLYFRLHVADWDGLPDSRPVIEGIYAWAKQYEGNVPGEAGLLYDESAIYGKLDLSIP